MDFQGPPADLSTKDESGSSAASMSTAESPNLESPASPPSKKPRLSAAGGACSSDNSAPVVGNNSTSDNMNSAASNGSANNNGASGGPSGGSENGSGGGGIDEGLYSRQIYVLGREAMARMATSNVLVSGLGGLGVEVAKNVILGGVKSVTLQDTQDTKWDDLSSQFYLKKSDIGKNRAEQCHQQLVDLNNYVEVKKTTEPLTPELIEAGNFKTVVVTDGAGSVENLMKISQFCHDKNIHFILAESRGLFSRVFCDFGEDFKVTDTNGEVPALTMIAGITQEEKAVITCLDEARHGLEDGDYVTFSEIQGMAELNGCDPVKIEVTGPYTFKLCRDTSGTCVQQSHKIID
jgi:ubiquitin-activating enzyme E1